MVTSTAPDFRSYFDLVVIRLPSLYPPPESNAYVILGYVGLLFGIGTIYSSIHPSSYNLRYPNSYRYLTILRGIGWLIIGLFFWPQILFEKFENRRSLTSSNSCFVNHF